jgi:hypothetical protein
VRERERRLLHQEFHHWGRGGAKRGHRQGGDDVTEESPCVLWEWGFEKERQGDAKDHDRKSGEKKLDQKAPGKESRVETHRQIRRGEV